MFEISRPPFDAVSTHSRAGCTLLELGEQRARIPAGKKNGALNNNNNSKKKIFKIEKLKEWKKKKRMDERRRQRCDGKGLSGV